MNSDINLSLSPSGKVPEPQPNNPETTIKTNVVYLIGMLLLILLLCGIAGLIADEAKYGKYWEQIWVMLSSSIFGFIGYITGEKSSQKEK